jgi:hypothetical protein
MPLALVLRLHQDPSPSDRARPAPIAHAALMACIAFPMGADGSGREDR